MHVLTNDELNKFNKHQDKYLSQLQSHPVKTETLNLLQKNSGQFILKVARDKMTFIAGERIGGIQIQKTQDAKSLVATAAKYFEKFGALYGIETPLPGPLKVERVKQNAQTNIKVQQFVDELPVLDARFTMIFDEAGYLQQVTGCPFGADDLKIDCKPSVTQNDAIRAVIKALEKKRDKVGRPIKEDQFQIEHRLGILGRQQRLVWVIELTGFVEIGLSKDAQVDAHTGEVITIESCCVDGTRMIPVTHYQHHDGVLNSTGDTRDVDINVNTEERRVFWPFFFFIPERRFSLQRLGSGRSRIWNAEYNGTSHPPSFTRTWTRWANIFSPRYWSTDLFTQPPGGHASKVFNEQQTYYYSQLLKTYADQWGRRPNSYSHYPVNDDRAVNVEIVVNANATMEGSWCGVSVMHGCFARNVPVDWFDNYPEDKERVPTVFLYNSSGNSTSPQYFGPEDSSSYSIIAHEVGHFISWQYGGWQGPTGTSIGGSLNEGFSMVFPALVGKKRWPELDYTDSIEVTTGSFISGSQWPHHVPGTPALQYSSLNCTDNAYHLAWPFTQAMWNLIHNQDKNGDPIWATQEAAINNTADMFMYALYNYTEDSMMTWDRLSVGMVAYMWLHLHIQEGVLPESLIRVIDVFDAHGLFDECL
jgi:hypothetical protein